MKRINPKVEESILNKILLGYAYSDIAIDTGVAVSTIKKIKARNKARFEINKQELRQWTSNEARDFLQRSYRLLDHILDNNEISPKKLTVKELVFISNQMFIHEQITSTYSSKDTLIEKQQSLKCLLSKLKK